MKLCAESFLFGSLGVSEIRYIYARKSNGARTDLWGKPLTTFLEREYYLSTRTLKDRLLKKDEIQAKRAARMPWCSNLYNNCW